MEGQSRARQGSAHSPRQDHIHLAKLGNKALTNLTRTRRLVTRAVSAMLTRAMIAEERPLVDVTYYGLAPPSHAEFSPVDDEEAVEIGRGAHSVVYKVRHSCWDVVLLRTAQTTSLDGLRCVRSACALHAGFDIRACVPVCACFARVTSRTAGRSRVTTDILWRSSCPARLGAYSSVQGYRGLSTTPTSCNTLRIGGGGW